VREAASLDACPPLALKSWDEFLMDPHYWADWAVIAQVVLAFIAGILVYFQIWSSQQESRKWKTLDICAQRELSDSLASAVEELRDFFNKDPQPDIKNFESKWKMILNYLDGIAIGVEQGLYIEDLVKDHLKQIVEHHVREAFEIPGYLAKNKCDYLKIV
jgi:hypothetical protein